MQTTVVGNYPKIPNRPRPARLRQAINRRDRGEITSEELARIEDEVTVEVNGEQIEVALAGELRNEVQALAEAGAPIIQVNDPVIVFNKDDIDIFSRALTRMLNGVQAETAVYTWFGSAAGILPALLDLPVATIG